MSALRSPLRSPFGVGLRGPFDTPGPATNPRDAVIAALFGGGDTGIVIDPSTTNQVFADTSKTTLAVPNSDTAAVLSNLSGTGGADATQADGSKRAAYETDGTEYWLQPDGLDDRYSLGAALNLETFTAFQVTRVAAIQERVMDNRGTGATGATSGWHIKSRGEGNNDMAIIDDGSGNLWRWAAKDASEDPEGAFVLQTLRYQPNDGLYRHNGVVVTPIISSASMGSILSSVGGQLFYPSNFDNTQRFSGKFLYSAVTSRYVPDDEIAEIEAMIEAIAKGQA